MKSFILLFSLVLLYSCSHPITATSNKVGEAKGVACTKNIMFIIPLSLDNSIYTAAKNGDIEKISTVDSKSFYTGIYNQNCTIVRGHKKALVAKDEPTPSLLSEIVPEEKNGKEIAPDDAVVPLDAVAPTDTVAPADAADPELLFAPQISN